MKARKHLNFLYYQLLMKSSDHIISSAVIQVFDYVYNYLLCKSPIQACIFKDAILGFIMS